MRPERAAIPSISAGCPASFCQRLFTRPPPRREVQPRSCRQSEQRCYHSTVASSKQPGARNEPSDVYAMFIRNGRSRMPPPIGGRVRRFLCCSRICPQRRRMTVRPLPPSAAVTPTPYYAPRPPLAFAAAVAIRSACHAPDCRRFSATTEPMPRHAAHAVTMVREPCHPYLKPAPTHTRRAAYAAAQKPSSIQSRRAWRRRERERGQRARCGGAQQRCSTRSDKRYMSSHRLLAMPPTPVCYFRDLSSRARAVGADSLLHRAHHITPPRPVTSSDTPPSDRQPRRLHAQNHAFRRRIPLITASDSRCCPSVACLRPIREYAEHTPAAINRHGKNKPV